MWKEWKKWLQHFVTSRLVKHLLKAVHEDQLLIQTNRGWYVGTRKLSPEEVARLRDDARQFENSHLWRFIRREIRFMAFLQATNKARTDSDLLYSSAMYYDLEIIEKFITKCKEL